MSASAILGAIDVVIGIVLAAIGAVASIVAIRHASTDRRRQTSPERFREERRELASERPALTQRAFESWPEDARGQFGGMLSTPAWLPPRPFPLRDIHTALAEDDHHFSSHPLLRAATKRLPLSASGTRYQRYSAAMADLAPSQPFIDRPCYRLTGADLASPAPQIVVGRTTYFRAIDEGEALAHEAAARTRDHQQAFTGPVRREIDDPFDFDQRNQIFAVSALTLRVEPDASATFMLHSRDNKGVAVAGSLLHLAPSGVFQPCCDDLQTVRRDCDPWLTLCREFAEEFLGAEEAEGDNGAALSYSLPPYGPINEAYLTGGLRVHVLGMGLDPLTLFAELVVIVCVDSAVFDDIFAELVMVNAEGKFRGKALVNGRIEGYRFDEETVESLLRHRDLSPAAHAALRGAWTHREMLLAGRA